VVDPVKRGDVPEAEHHPDFRYPRRTVHSSAGRLHSDELIAQGGRVSSQGVGIDARDRSSSTMAAASKPLSNKSSEKYSKLRPHKGLRLMFIPGRGQHRRRASEPPGPGLDRPPGPAQDPRTRQAQPPAGSRSPGGFDQDPGGRGSRRLGSAARVVRPPDGATGGRRPGRMRWTSSPRRSSERFTQQRLVAQALKQRYSEQPAARTYGVRHLSAPSGTDDLRRECRAAAVTRRRSPSQR
jgi:hypothetical protein